jgi:hypothetical protein
MQARSASEGIGVADSDRYPVRACVWPRLVRQRSLQ